MSVLMKGINMPESCRDCPCWWEDSDFWNTSYCQAGSKFTVDPLTEEYLFPGRPDDCPLFEVKAWEEM